MNLLACQMSFDSTESKLVVYYETDGAIWAPERPDYEAFFKAVTAGILADVKTALNAHIEINAMHGHGEDGETALHMASAAGHVDIVEYLIANGAIVDSHDIGQHGPSRPLHDAAFFGRARVVEVLLNNGADITALGEQGGTVIQQVLRSEKRVEPRHIETIVLLLDRGHDIHSGAIELGGTVVRVTASATELRREANRCSFIKPLSWEASNLSKYSLTEALILTSTALIVLNRFSKQLPPMETATPPISSLSMGLRMMKTCLKGRAPPTLSNSSRLIMIIAD